MTSLSFARASLVPLLTLLFAAGCAASSNSADDDGEGQGDQALAPQQAATAFRLTDPVPSTKPDVTNVGSWQPIVIDDGTFVLIGFGRDARPSEIQQLAGVLEVVVDTATHTTLVRAPSGTPITMTDELTTAIDADVRATLDGMKKHCRVTQFALSASALDILVNGARAGIACAARRASQCATGVQWTLASVASAYVVADVMKKYCQE
jgi:hypothetical protein